MTGASHQADTDTTWPHGPLTLVLFDLDGTLSDSARGITASMRHALGAHDVAVPEQHVLDSFVGPPFKVALEGIGIPAEQVPGIVGTYREDYNAGRLFDNDLYPGMADLLAELHAAGVSVAVATSKPQPTARRIVAHFGLEPYLTGGLDGVFGADITRPDDAKADVIVRALAALGRDAGPDVVMVGDRLHDVEGAARHGIATIGVSWGYAADDELARAGAVAVVDTAEQLAALLLPRAQDETADVH